MVKKTTSVGRGASAAFVVAWACAATGIARAASVARWRSIMDALGEYTRVPVVLESTAGITKALRPVTRDAARAAARGSCSANEPFHTGDGDRRTAKSGVRRHYPGRGTPYAGFGRALIAVTGVQQPQ